MNEKNVPGIYTQPDGDADDVLGHKRPTGDKTYDKARAHDDADDVEGHRRFDDDADDVEGHSVRFDRTGDKAV